MSCELQLLRKAMVDEVPASFLVATAIGEDLPGFDCQED